MTAFLIVVKIFLNGAIAISLSLDSKWGLACMFVGFAVADVGSFWAALR